MIQFDQEIPQGSVFTRIRFGGEPNGVEVFVIGDRQGDGVGTPNGRCWIELGQRLAKWNRYIIPAQVVNQ